MVSNFIFGLHCFSVCFSVITVMFDAQVFGWKGRNQSDVFGKIWGLFSTNGQVSERADEHACWYPQQHKHRVILSHTCICTNTRALTHIDTGKGHVREMQGGGTLIHICKCRAHNIDGFKGKWTLKNIGPPLIPQQTDSTSCGIFVFSSADCIRYNISCAHSSANQHISCQFV